MTSSDWGNKKKTWPQVWIRHYSESKIYLNIVQGFHTLAPKLSRLWLECESSVHVHEELLKSLHRLKLSDSDLSTA